jgi:hypothetical protein
MSQEEQMKILSFLDKNNDVFTWSTTDLESAEMSYSIGYKLAQVQN